MPAAVYADETQVVPLLTKMGLPRWAILEIASQVAGERVNVSPDDAPPVIGFETWRWGTRYSREHAELKALGWLPCEANQVSGLYHRERDIKLVFCNTDANTGRLNKQPKNTNEKGPASCRLIGSNAPERQSSLFPVSDPVKNPPELWYFCAYFCDAHIAVEISMPVAEIGGIVSDFSTRIIVAQPGEIPGVRRHVVPQEYADVPKPKVTRKS